MNLFEENNRMKDMMGLNESKQVGPLYHFTDVDAAIGILYSNTFNQTTPFIINTSILPPSLSSIKSGTTPITSYAFNFILEDTFNLSSIMNSNNFVVGGSGNNVQFVLYGANGDPSLIDASLNTGFLINVQTEFLLNTNS